MAICYELAQNMALVPEGSTRTSKAAVPLVEVVAPDEHDAIEFISPEGREALRSLTEAPSNFVDSYQNFIVGSFDVPDMEDASVDPQLFSFYLDPTHLVFVDGGSTCADILAAIASCKAMRTMTTPHCLYVFMKRLLMDHFDRFDAKEDAMEDIEEAIMVGRDHHGVGAIMGYRRLSMKLGAYYSQVAAMADLLADNENQMMNRTEARDFEHIQFFADRLATRADALKEYSLQLHELHQTSIDLTQNSIMQTFTIVTVLFAPLTLITGWFGMNLVGVPGMDWPYTFLLLIVVAAICTTMLLLWFHKRRWL